MTYKDLSPVDKWQIETIGDCFKMSAKDSLDSVEYAKRFLNSSWGESLISGERLKEFCSTPYMYAKSKKILKTPKGESYDPYELWSYGYLVSYLVKTKGISSKEVWNILPIDVFVDRFGKYHTQGWEYIIKDASKG